MAHTQKEAIQPNAVYTSTEAAQVLGLTAQTIAKYIKKGELKASLIGGKWYRITGQSLLDYLNEAQEVQLLPSSRRYEDGWMPQIDIVRHEGDKVRIKTWGWENRRLESREAADYVAKFLAKRLLLNDQYVEDNTGLSIDVNEEKPERK